MIRLACQGYDRGDYDGTTLEKALDDGWEDISEEQTYEGFLPGIQTRQHSSGQINLRLVHSDNR